MNGKKGYKSLKKTLRNLKVIGLDTNLFIYYFEGHSRFGPFTKEVFNALAANDIRAVTSILSITETLSKKSLPDKVAYEIQKSLFEIPNLKIVDVDRIIAAEAARVRRKYGFRLPDSIQLATALSAKAKAFITNDDRLKKFKELKIILLKSI